MYLWNLSGLLLSAPDLELNSQPTQSRASPEKGWRALDPRLSTGLGMETTQRQGTAQ